MGTVPASRESKAIAIIQQKQKCLNRCNKLSKHSGFQAWAVSDQINAKLLKCSGPEEEVSKTEQPMVGSKILISSSHQQIWREFERIIQIGGHWCKVFIWKPNLDDYLTLRKERRRLQAPGNGHQDWNMLLNRTHKLSLGCLVSNMSCFWIDPPSVKTT